MSGNGSIWTSEAFTYGLMILNVLALAGLLLWAWRKGHLDDLESAAAVVDPRSTTEEDDRD